jgi:NADP-dependent 3-hydroxy acid dehydrogenase YdfG
MSKTVLVTGASSGFGAMTVRALADAGHLVYAGIRQTTGRNKAAVDAAADYARTNSVQLRTVELDVRDQHSVEAAIGRIITDAGAVDVVVHNAGHMVLGPTEAFTPDQLVSIYESNVVSTQRVNRAILPHLRAKGDGLLGPVSDQVRGAWRAHTLEGERRDQIRLSAAAPARSAGSSASGRDGARVRRGREALGAPAAGDGATQ